MPINDPRGRRLHIRRQRPLARYNNLEPNTYRYGAVAGKSDPHVDISKYPRGEFLFPTWERKNSSEESNETSEEMIHAHVGNKKYPRGDFEIPTWKSAKGWNRMNPPVKKCKGIGCWLLAGWGLVVRD